MQRTSLVALCTVIFMAVGGGTTLRAQQPITDRWSRMADTNFPHQYHTAVAVEGKIYVVGGDGYGSKPTHFEVFNPETNQWVTLPYMPTPRSFLGAAVVQKKIYTMGGMRSSHEAYDITENAWIKCADLPTPRNRLAAVAVAGKVYALGGMNKGQDTGIVEVYDPDEDSWERIADMPSPRHGHSAVVVNGLILIVGGYRLTGGGLTPLSTVDQYDPATDRWTKKANMPTPRGFLGVVVAKGQVFALAGRVRGEPPIERYDPETNVWERLGTMPNGFRNRFGIAAVNDMIYVIGGEFQGDAQTPVSVLRYDPEDGR